MLASEVIAALQCPRCLEPVQTIDAPALRLARAVKGRFALRLPRHRARDERGSLPQTPTLTPAPERPDTMAYNSGKGKKPFRITLALEESDMLLIQAYRDHVRGTHGLEATPTQVIYALFRRALEHWQQAHQLDPPSRHEPPVHD